MNHMQPRATPDDKLRPCSVESHPYGNLTRFALLYCMFTRICTPTLINRGGASEWRAGRHMHGACAGTENI